MSEAAPIDGLGHGGMNAGGHGGGADLLDAVFKSRKIVAGIVCAAATAGLVAGLYLGSSGDMKISVPVPGQTNEFITIESHNRASVDGVLRSLFGPDASASARAGVMHVLRDQYHIFGGDDRTLNTYLVEQINQKSSNPLADDLIEDARNTRGLFELRYENVYVKVAPGTGHQVISCARSSFYQKRILVKTAYRANEIGTDLNVSKVMPAGNDSCTFDGMPTLVISRDVAAQLFIDCNIPDAAMGGFSAQLAIIPFWWDMRPTQGDSGVVVEPKRTCA